MPERICRRMPVSFSTSSRIFSELVALRMAEVAMGSSSSQPSCSASSFASFTPLSSLFTPLELMAPPLSRYSTNFIVAFQSLMGVG